MMYRAVFLLIAIVSLFAEPDFLGLQSQGWDTEVRSGSSHAKEEILAGPDLFDNKKIPQGKYSSEEFESRFLEWSRNIRVASGIRVEDFLERASSEEITFLLSVLESLKIQSDQEGGREASEEFHRNLDHTFKNMSKSQRLLQGYSLMDLREIRTDGWGDHQSDRDDVMMTRAFLLALEKRNLKESEMLLAIEKKLFGILSASSVACARDGIGMVTVGSKGEVRAAGANGWVGSIQKASEYPWNQVISKSSLHEGFEFTASVIVYLHSIRSHLFVLETILQIAGSESVQKAFRTFSLLKKYDLKKLEFHYGGKKPQIWVDDIVKLLKGNISRVSLAKALYEKFSPISSSQQVLEQMKNAALRMASSQEILEALKSANSQESQSLIEGMVKKQNWVKSVDALSKINMADPSLIDAQAKAEFDKESGVLLSELIKTGGDQKQITDLFSQKWQTDFQDVEKIRKKVRAVSQVSSRLLGASGLEEGVKKATDLRISKAVESSQGNQWMSVKAGKVVLKAQALQSLSEKDFRESAAKLKEDFKENLKGASEDMDHMKNRALELEGMEQDVNQLVAELKSMGEVSLESADGDWYGKIQSVSEQILEITNEVRSRFSEFEQGMLEFEAARSELFQSLSIQDPGAGTFSDVLAKWLKDHAFNPDLDQKFQRIASEFSELCSKYESVSGFLQWMQEKNQKLNALKGELGEMLENSEQSVEKNREKRAILEQKHRELYAKTQWLSPMDREQIRKKATMSATIDSGFANSFIHRYLVGKLQADPGSGMTVRDFFVMQMNEDGVIFKAVLVSRSGEEKELELALNPRVVKTKINEFDFVIESFTFTENGKKQEYSSELSSVLDSGLIPVLNALVGGLNTNQSSTLGFRFFSHLKTLRVVNSIALFEAFPNFSVDMIELSSGKAFIYSTVDGKKLGAKIASLVNLGGEKPKNPILLQPKPVVSKPRISPSDSFVKPSLQATVAQQLVDSGSAHKKSAVMASVKPQISGIVSMVIKQDLPNLAFRGFREGINKKYAGVPISDETLKGRLASLFRGLEEFRLIFGQDGAIGIEIKGNLQTISKETSDWYFKLIDYVAMYNAGREGLAEGWSHVVSFVTLGNVEVTVDKNKYKNPTGKFLVGVQGKSSFSASTLQLQFGHLSIVDPEAPGALQPFVNLAKSAGKAVRFLGDLGNGVNKALNLIPGVNRPVTDANADEMILDLVMFQLAHQMNQSVHGLIISVDSYKKIGVVFEDFQLVDKVKCVLDSVVIRKNEIGISARLVP